MNIKTYKKHGQTMEMHFIALQIIPSTPFMAMNIFLEV